MTRGVRRVAAGAALALLLTAAPAAGATTSTHAAPDPIGDGRLYRANDITGIRVTNRDTVTLRLTTRFGASPSTHPAWRDPEGDTRIVWSLETDGDPGPEYQVRYVSSVEGPDTVRVVVLEDGSHACAAPLVHDGDRYVVQFDWMCIGGPGRLRARVQYRYDPPDGEARIDAAPNGGRYTPEVVYPVPI